MSTPIVVTHACSLFHDGLRQVFAKSRFRPVRISPTLSEGLEAYLRSLNSCIWLIGVERCVSTTNDLVQRVVTTTPGVKAVILAAYQMPDDILAALKAGACGFLCQEIPGERLIKSLELIALGEMVVHPQYSWGQLVVGQIQANGELEDNSAFHAKNGESYLARHSDPRSRPPVPGLAMEPSSESQAGDVARGLSRREMLILRILMEGASNKVVALKLVMTESTVKVHMKAILRKLRLQNRTQAAIWARDHSSELASCARESLERTRCGPTIEPGLCAGPSEVSRRARAAL
jgi:two-component system nitrate/nitrite response regulator NarL